MTIIKAPVTSAISHISVYHRNSCIPAESTNQAICGEHTNNHNNATFGKHHVETSVAVTDHISTLWLLIPSTNNLNDLGQTQRETHNTRNNVFYYIKKSYISILSPSW